MAGYSYTHKENSNTTLVSINHQTINFKHTIYTNSNTTLVSINPCYQRL